MIDAGFVRGGGILVVVFSAVLEIVSCAMCIFVRVCVV